MTDQKKHISCVGQGPIHCCFMENFKKCDEVLFTKYSNKTKKERVPFPFFQTSMHKIKTAHLKFQLIHQSRRSSTTSLSMHA